MTGKHDFAKCETCLYFFNDAGADAGICRLMPPRLMEDSVTAYPSVSEFWFCGQWVDRAEGFNLLDLIRCKFGHAEAVRNAGFPE